MKIDSAAFVKGIRGTDPILAEPRPQVAFIGRSNAGKSSLMNCLLQRNGLVKSGKTPGKTQELNFFLVNNRFYFVDLPGYGYAKLPGDVREQLARMIQWYFLQSGVAELKPVIVLDAKAGPTAMDIEMLRLLREGGLDPLVVANKIDRLNQSERSAQLRLIAAEMPGVEVIPCSAKTKEGREAILANIFG